MDNYYNKFYERNSNKFKKYKFSGGGKFVSGEIPELFKYIKKYSNRESSVLDIGCGSGELDVELAPYFKEIIGIDLFEEYIKSSKKLADNTGMKNVSFQVADGKNLPFNNEYFDIIISSRGPLSESIDFIKEGYRVLKKDGLLLEETIGENDKIELKKIFGRGQNYPARETKLESVNNQLIQSSMELIDSKYYIFFQVYPSLIDVINLLERAPIIPDFDKNKDKIFIELIEKELDRNGIKLSSHRLLWTAKKTH